MSDTPELPEQTIFEEFHEWTITPMEVGWSATRTSNDGANIHTVAAPTIHELRLRLRDVRDRAARSPAYVEP